MTINPDLRRYLPSPWKPSLPRGVRSGVVRALGVRSVLGARLEGC